MLQNSPKKNLVPGVIGVILVKTNIFKSIHIRFTGSLLQRRNIYIMDLLKILVKTVHIQKKKLIGIGIGFYFLVISEKALLIHTERCFAHKPLPIGSSHSHVLCNDT